jgi:Tol biopolymer transport system component
LPLEGLAPNCRRAGPESQQIAVSDARVSDAAFAVSCFAPFADKILVDIGRDIYIVGSGGGFPVPLLQSAEWEGTPAPSPDGLRFAYYYNNHVGTCGLGVADADGKGARRLTTTCDYQPSWSPDGTKLAIVRYGEDENGSGDSDIWVMNADGTDARNVTNTPGLYEEHPSWSPDGASLVFEGNNVGGGLYVMRADGSGRHQITTVSSDEEAVWSPAGNRIVFARHLSVANTRAIYTMAPDGTTVARVTQLSQDTYFDSSPTWSPDGARLAFVRYLGSSYDLFSIAANGTDERRLTNGRVVHDATWSHD